MHWFPLLGSLKNLTTGLIWLVTMGGMGGGVAHGGRARGEMRGGAPESSVGAKKVHWFSCFGLQGGEMGGGPESSVGAIKGAPFFLGSLQNPVV